MLYTNLPKTFQLVILAMISIYLTTSYWIRKIIELSLYKFTLTRSLFSGIDYKYNRKIMEINESLLFKIKFNKVRSDHCIYLGLKEDPKDNFLFLIGIIKQYIMLLNKI